MATKGSHTVCGLTRPGTSRPPVHTGFPAGRVSRELHDDIAQRIALLATELAILRQRLISAPSDIQEHVARVATQTANIGADLLRIARGLHPAGLERLGLEASIRHHCLQVANAHQITIEVVAGIRLEGNGFASIFNIEADPREEVNVVGTNGWVIPPYLQTIGEYLKALEQYPNPKQST